MPKPKRKKPRLWWGTDTETTGADFEHGCLPFYVSSACEDGTTKVWEWDVDPFTRVPKIPPKEKREVLDHINTNSHVWHNAKFDVRALAKAFKQPVKWGVDLLDRSHDTILAHHLLDSNASHKLKDICEDVLGIDVEDQSELREAVNEARRYGRKNGWRIANAYDPHFPAMKRAPKDGWTVLDYWLPRAVAKAEDLPEDHHYWTVLSRYATLDAERTIALWGAMKEALDDDPGLWELYKPRQRQLAITYKMETHGVTVNQKELDKAIEDYGDLADEAKRMCLRYARGKVDNLNSPKQLQGLLFGTFGVTPVKETKTGWSTDKDSLTAILGNLPTRSRAYRFITHLNTYRKMEKAVDYLDSYRLCGLPVVGDFIRVHPSFNITGTKTTRFSSSSPNAQNISKQEDFNLRRVFGPMPGREWWAIDYENIEKRIPAHLAGEQELIDLFNNGDSYHLLVASIVREVMFKKLGPDGFKKTQEYRWTKNGNFAEQYGGQEQTVDEAFHVRGGFKKVKGRFKKIDALSKEVLKLAREQGYVTTLGGYPLQCPMGHYGVIPTTPFNYFIQGTAGWILTLAMVKVDRYLRKLNHRLGLTETIESLDFNKRKEFPTLGFRMVMTIHDELVFDFPIRKKSNKPIIRDIVGLMEDAGRDLCGFTTPVDADHITTNWAEGKGVTL